eukprot:sb/3462294/
MVKKQQTTEDGQPIRMKRAFKLDRKLEPFYTGGPISLSPDKEFLFCQCENIVRIVRVATGETFASFGSEEDAVVTITGDDETLFTAHRSSLLIKQWRWKDGSSEEPVRSFKAHTVPVTSLDMDSSSTLLASGATDGAIRVWDIEKNYCTHQFKGSVGVITLLEFRGLQLFSSADDLKVRVWCLDTSSPLFVLSGHVSPVTSLVFLRDDTVVSAGRDKVLIRWNLEGEGERMSTLPVFECIEGAVLGEGGNSVVTAGEKGVLRTWDMNTLKCTKEQSEPALKREFVNLLPYTKGAMMAVTFDQNIMIHNAELELQRNLIGYNDEIIDLKRGSVGRIIMATNSEQLRIINTESLATTVLSGHKATVLAIDTSVEHGLLASGSKDSSVIVWKEGEDSGYTPVTTLTGHTSDVSGVAWSNLPENLFLVTVSSDLTLKLWQPSKGRADKLHKTKCVYTVKAHEKDVNCVTVSPNDKLVITGSLDKTAKVWSADKGQLMGTLRGHKRGIWSARFSPVDQCVITTSGDALLKLWRLSDFSCIRTYESHSASVLNCQFLTHGRQVVSCCADGLVKVWDVSTAECLTTMDGHTDKCWALLAGEGEGSVVVSGAADSLLCFWKDITAEEEAEELRKDEEQSEKQQELSNLVRQKNYPAAFALSLSLGMPYKCLTVTEKVFKEQDGEVVMRNLITDLAMDQLDTLLGYIATWNTNSKHTVPAQKVLFSLLSSKHFPVLARDTKMKHHWEALIPYTERHFERWTKLKQQATIVNYTWSRMKLTQV